MTKSQVLEEILGNCKLSDFSREWVENSSATDESIRSVYEFLRQIGLTDEKIALHAHLLGRDPETIKRNYQHHIRLLRQNYEDRNSGREILIMNPQLLGIPPETIEANVQNLYALSIDYNNAFLLGTSFQLKRKKMAWLLREVFDYRTSKDKKETIRRMYDFVKQNPRYLVKSITALERSKDKIKNKISNIK